MLEPQPYHEELAQTWEDFVKKSSNGNLFNLRRFLKYHPPERFKDASFLLRHKGNIRALVPGILTGERWISHGGASYGGIVLGDQISMQLCRDAVETSVNYVRSLGAKSFTMTITPAFYPKVPHDYVQAALLYAGFRYAKREITNACGRLHPQFFEDWVNKTRGACRHAINAGIEIVYSQYPSSEEMDSFYHILKSNRDSLGVGITHSREDLQSLFEVVPEALDFYLAKYQGINIGCALVFRCNPQVDLIFYVAHLKEHQHLKPIPLLVKRIYQEALNRQVPWVDYGTSTLNGVLTNNGLLMAFKENFNMLGYFRDTFVLDL